MNGWNYGMLFLPNSVYLSWNWSFYSINLVFVSDLFVYCWWGTVWLWSDPWCLHDQSYSMPLRTTLLWEKIQVQKVLYILTSVWVLGTPNNVQNLVFHVFHKYLLDFDTKMMKNGGCYNNQCLSYWSFLYVIVGPIMLITALHKKPIFAIFGAYNGWKYVL